ncbi:MAG: transaldolase family protein [Limnochordia bacterium]|jgi:transaldolase
MVLLLPSVKDLPKSNNRLELWFDSSPCSFFQWRDSLQLAPEKQGCLWNDHNIASSLIQGSTTNPAIVLNTVKELMPSLERWMREKSPSCPSAQALAWALYKEIAARGARALLPLYEATAGKRGYISVQVDPRLETWEDIVRQGIELSRIAANVQIKLPGTKQGIDALRELTAMGISTNVTLCFTVSQLIAVAKVVRQGWEEARAKGLDLTRWRSNAIMMLGRFEESTEFTKQAAERNIRLSEQELRWVGLAILKRAYAQYNENNYVTQLMAASMRPGPTINGITQVWHVQKLAGMNVVLTIFPNIWEVLLAQEGRLPYPNAANENIEQELLSKLLQVPLFYQAYEPQALVADDFAGFPPVVETRKSFISAMHELEELMEPMTTDRRSSIDIR